MCPYVYMCTISSLFQFLKKKMVHRNLKTSFCVTHIKAKSTEDVKNWLLFAAKQRHR